jgi:16S rRNA G966 N2-methylase RsmD
MRIAVTTTHQELNQDLLRLFLAETGWRFLPRRRRSLVKLLREYDLEGIIVWGKYGPALHWEGKAIFFHPSMAKNRRQLLQKQAEDVFSRVCRLERGDQFLDCTLGLGADAIIAAYHTESAVVGLESEPVLAAVIKWGMKLYDCGNIPWLRPLLNRIQVIAEDHYGYLRRQADRSYDVVYFDPMFRQPLQQSQAISVIRGLANTAALRPETIREACRVARKKVILKETMPSQEFARLGFDQVVSGRHSPVGYGVIALGQ